ncbi:MAG: hypothetical protein AAF975_05200 [Spirochaetota bacterium]
MVRLIPFLLLLLVFNPLPNDKLAAQSTNSNNNFNPVPYGDDEFPTFLQDLRRFEVVLLGSIPITLLLDSLVYDIIYSAGDPNITSLTVATHEEAILQKIGISISISGLLAAVDMIIHLGKRKKARKERERIVRDSESVQGAKPPRANAKQQAQPENP